MDRAAGQIETCSLVRVFFLNRSEGWFFYIFLRKALRMAVLQLILLPFSYCYGLLMMVRNWLFDAGILKSRAFDVPLISVGNLTAGGTGKTPHIEYLIGLLQEKYQVATLSRGYGRESSGYILASKRSNYKYIGDEPMQFVRKFPAIRVAVDANRTRGISALLKKFPHLNVILLDDAFQHRRVKPGLSILLTDYHRLYPEDHVIPSGLLREFPCGARRADIIVVTKTPKVFSPITRRRILEDIHPLSRQQVFFSYIRYEEPVAAFEWPDPFLSKYSSLLLVSGIANDDPLREHLERRCTELIRFKFPDHHPFTENDIRKIKAAFDALPTKKKAIVTTEKDLMRLRIPDFQSLLKSLPIYYQPITVCFHGPDQAAFDQSVLNYVGRNV